MFQVNKSSSDFWNSLKLTWQQCADLPSKYWAAYVTCVAELDGKVYVTALCRSARGAYSRPLMYDSKNDQWSSLPPLPFARFSLVTVPDKKQLLAIGGMVNNNGVIEVSNKVFLWDEENRKWTTPYPNMPTARYYCSSVSHGSTVIVAGGITCVNPWTMTRAVEVLHIKEHSLFSKSHWSVVEHLPHAIYSAIPLIINNELYITLGSNKNSGASTCNVVTASLPELLQSTNESTSSGQVWNKLPDMPYISFSISHYQGRLITFSGAHRIEQPNTDKPVHKSVPLIHTYNPSINTWDCVGEIPYEYMYSLGKAIHIRDDKILFIGGMTGTCNADNSDDIITTCLMLTLSPR